MIWLLVSRGGYLKVSGRGESHCRSVGTELPGHHKNEEQFELEDKNLRKKPP